MERVLLAGDGDLPTVERVLLAGDGDLPVEVRDVRLRWAHSFMCLVRSQDDPVSPAVLYTLAKGHYTHSKQTSLHNFTSLQTPCEPIHYLCPERALVKRRRGHMTVAHRAEGPSPMTLRQPTSRPQPPAGCQFSAESRALRKTGEA